MAISSKSVFINKTLGQYDCWLFKRRTCRIAWENTCKVWSNKNRYNKHRTQPRKHVQNAIRHKTLPKTKQLLHFKSELLKKTYANRLSKSANYAKSSKHFSEINQPASQPASPASQPASQPSQQPQNIRKHIQNVVRGAKSLRKSILVHSHWNHARKVSAIELLQKHLKAIEN